MLKQNDLPLEVGVVITMSLPAAAWVMASSWWEYSDFTPLEFSANFRSGYNEDGRSEHLPVNTIRTLTHLACLAVTISTCATWFCREREKSFKCRVWIS